VLHIFAVCVLCAYSKCTNAVVSLSLRASLPRGAVLHGTLSLAGLLLVWLPVVYVCFRLQTIKQ